MGFTAHTSKDDPLLLPQLGSTEKNNNESLRLLFQSTTIGSTKEEE
jgi:hypothetical protein